MHKACRMVIHFSSKVIFLLTVLVLVALQESPAVASLWNLFAGFRGDHPQFNLDENFGSYGFSTVPDFVGSKMKLDGLGRIYIAGSIQGTALQGTEGVYRLLPSGQIDRTFGVRGFASLPLTGYHYAKYDHAMFVDPKGSVLLASSQEGYYKMFLYRILEHGELDKSFCQSGSWTFNLGEMTGYSENKVKALSVETTPTGEIFIFGLGQFEDVEGDFTYSPFILKLGSDCQLDKTFGKKGIAVFLIYGRHQWPEMAEMSFDGSFYFGGILGGRGPYIVKLTAQGNPDPKFGKQGVVLFPFTQDVYEGVTSIIESENSLYTTMGGTNAGDAKVAKIDATTGVLVPEFGQEGFTHFPMRYPTMGSGPHDVVLTQSKDLFVPGRVERDIDWHRKTVYAVTHILPDGKLDRNFGEDGMLTLDTNHFDEMFFSGVDLGNNSMLFFGKGDSATVTRFNWKQPQ